MREYNKLVRDNIPNIIKNNNEIPHVRILDDAEYKKELDKKLLEEVLEYLEDDSIEELADVYEVFIHILKTKNISISELTKKSEKKKIENGAFANKIFLEKVCSK